MMVVVDTLQGRTALVTGASGGIGTALARRLADEGVDLALAFAGHRDDAEALAAECSDRGVRTVALRADLAEPEESHRLAEAAFSALGPLDIVVPGAGAGTRTDWQDVDHDLWQRTFTVNTWSPFALAQAALPGMLERGWGRILLISSVAAFTGGVIGPHYTASKAALHGLVHSLASTGAPAGVTVNAVAPALITGTRMLPTGPGGQGDPAVPIPVGRLGRPEEVADLMLAMLRNGYLTGKVVALDGGLYPA